jgi:outer membrane lipoprotein carrier protein
VKRLRPTGVQRRVWIRSLALAPTAVSTLSLALALSGIAAASPAAADAPARPKLACADGAASALQRRYETVRDLEADFEQTTRSVALGRSGAVAKSRGSVVFAKPGRMRWTYVEPEPSLVVSDGKELWIYDPASREAQRLVVTEAYLSGAALSFLLGEGEILRDFVVEARECEETAALLDLVPREPATYERLEARIDLRSGELLETTVIDLLGNATTVALRDLRVNRDPDASLFHFEPPPGVRVLELGEGAR